MMLSRRIISRSFQSFRCVSAIHYEFPSQELKSVSQLPAFRQLHSTRVLFAKQQKNVKGKGKNSDSVEVEEVVLPDMDELGENLDRKVKYLVNELGKIRGGRATADMLNFVVVEAYGDRVPIADTAQITLKSPTKLVVSTFDATITNQVATALRECGLDFSPVVEGTTININVPKPSKEVRESLVKVASKLVEGIRTDIRHTRKTYMDKIKKLKGKVSEDDMKRLTKEVDSVVDLKNEKINKLLKDKETSIMEG